MAKSEKHPYENVIGFYIPPDRSSDWPPPNEHGEIVAPVSMTKQSFKDECDINNIVRDFTQMGMVAHVNERAAAGAFVDLPDQLDYQASLNIVKEAESAFSQLPAKLRARFDNDPEQFLLAMHDPDPVVQEELIALGLAKDLRPPKEPDPPPAPPKSTEPPK